MKIADTEWLVMRVVWQMGPVGAAEVIAAVLPQTGWSHRTVRTLLNRLVKKGAVRAEMVDGRNVYREDGPVTMRATGKPIVSQQGL